MSIQYLIIQPVYIWDEENLWHHARIANRSCLLASARFAIHAFLKLSMLFISKWKTVHPKAYIISLTMAIWFSIWLCANVRFANNTTRRTLDWASFLNWKERTYLANHFIKTKQAQTELECGRHCVADVLCASVNYKTSGIGIKHNHEFNHLYMIKKIWKIRALFDTVVVIVIN